MRRGESKQTVSQNPYHGMGQRPARPRGGGTKSLLNALSKYTIGISDPVNLVRNPIQQLRRDIVPGMQGAKIRVGRGFKFSPSSAMRTSEKGAKIRGLYHGSRNPPFERHETRRFYSGGKALGEGIYHTDDPGYASTFANMTPFGHMRGGSIRTSRPLDLTKPLSDSDARRLAHAAAARDVALQRRPRGGGAHMEEPLARMLAITKMRNYRAGIDDFFRPGDVFEARNSLLQALIQTPRALDRVIRHAGFDSVVAKNDPFPGALFGYGGDPPGRQFLTFGPGQVRDTPIERLPGSAYEPTAAQLRRHRATSKTLKKSKKRTLRSRP